MLYIAIYCFLPLSSQTSFLICLDLSVFYFLQVPKDKRVLTVPKVVEISEEQEKRSVTYHRHDR